MVFKAYQYKFYRRTTQMGWYDPPTDHVCVGIANIFNMNDLIELIAHEELHRAITKATDMETSERQDHYIIRAFGFD